LIKRIAVIGNGGGGKTTISRTLGSFYDIPVTHVDSVQYQEGWMYTPQDICDRILDEVAEGDKWLIDGFGNKPVIERRLKSADAVVFVDFPIYLHYRWALKRQIQSWKGSRSELPEGCKEFSFKFTMKLVKVMWEVDRDYVPWFRKLVSELSESTKLFHLRSPKEMRLFLSEFTDVSEVKKISPLN